MGKKYDDDDDYYYDDRPFTSMWDLLTDDPKGTIKDFLTCLGFFVFFAIIGYGSLLLLAYIL